MWHKGAYSEVQERAPREFDPLLIIMPVLMIYIMASMIASSSAMVSCTIPQTTEKHPMGL